MQTQQGKFVCKQCANKGYLQKHQGFINRFVYIFMDLKWLYHNVFSTSRVPVFGVTSGDS